MALAGYTCALRRLLFLSYTMDHWNRCFEDKAGVVNHLLAFELEEFRGEFILEFCRIQHCVSFSCFIATFIVGYLLVGILILAFNF